MKKLRNFESMSQFDSIISTHFHASACGPVTAFVILRYLNIHDRLTVNTLYKKLGTTKIGLFTWRFTRKLQTLLGDKWTIECCSITDVLKELDQGRPVAAKFDKWFRFKWRQQFSFSYHWVPVIGYEYRNGHLFLFIHDNGNKLRESKLHTVPYKRNEPVLTFVKISPKQIDL